MQITEPSVANKQISNAISVHFCPQKQTGDLSPKPWSNETKAEMMKKYQKDLRLTKNCNSCDYNVQAACGSMWANTAHQAEKFARNSERESITMQFIKTDAARTKGHRQLQLHRCVCVCAHWLVCVRARENLGYPLEHNDNYILGPLSPGLCCCANKIKIFLT